MLPQEIYDKTKAHLLTQRARSGINPSSYMGCLYRSPDGKACAVGAHMTDDEAASCGEGWSMPLNDSDYLAYASRYNTAQRVFIERMRSHKDNLALLKELQRVHDNEPVTLWERKLAAVAERFGLNP
jgi:hypothetical protein